MKAELLVILSLAAAAISVSAADIDSAAKRRLMYDTTFVRPQAATLENVALSGLRQPVSSTSISAGYTDARSGAAVTAACGRGDRKAFFHAKTFLKNDKSVITARAAYENGKVLDMQACETSDAALLFPYFTADEIGGDLDRERYTFGGTYASAIGRGFLYGVGLHYTAVQDSRRRDPRPKNVVGRLGAELSGGMNLGAYSLAASLFAGKYKQSNSIMFVSELGESPVYHTLGLGGHYARFEGLGKNSSYNGRWYGVQLAGAPVRKGAFGMAKFTRFTFSKQLVDLNRLPVVSAAHTALQYQAGWKTDVFSVSANMSVDRRTGTENIFGNPAGQSYPQIAALETYFYCRRNWGVEGVWRRIGSRSRIDLTGAVNYVCRTERRTEQSTARTAVRGINIIAGAEYLKRVSSRWLVTGKVSAQGAFPTRCSMTGLDLDAEPSFLSAAVVADYRAASCESYAGGLTVGADYLAGGSYSLGLRAFGGIQTMAHHSGRAVSFSLIFNI